MLARRCLDLAARQLLAQDDGAAGIQANQVEGVLADVDPKGGNVLKRSFRHGSVLVLSAPDEGCAGKHGRSIPLAALQATSRDVRDVGSVMVR